jgi:hypothetical protein
VQKAKRKAGTHAPSGFEGYILSVNKSLTNILPCGTRLAYDFGGAQNDENALEIPPDFLSAKSAIRTICANLRSY